MDILKESNFYPIFEYNLSEKIGNGYLPMVEDLSRVIILQTIIQFMYFIKNPSEFSMFDGRFIELIIYFVLSICVYWLVFKRLVILT